MMCVRHIVLTAIVAVSFVALQVQPVLAAFGITSAVGAIELPSAPPPNVYPGSNEGPLPIVFPEVLCGTVLTLAGLPVDHDGSNVVAQPTVSGNVVNPALISATLPRGTTFNSYMIHFDPTGGPFFAFYISTINFDNPIIGVQLFSNGFVLQKPAGTPYTGTLEAGDVEVNLNGGPVGIAPVLQPIYYPSGLAYRGLEEDSFVLAIAGNSVMLGGSTNGVEIDQVRIITACPITGGVPEPAAAVMWGIISAIGCCGVFLRRRG